MAAIILATLNAKYIHASFGLRYLKANLGDLEAYCRLLEYDIQQRPIEVAEALLAEKPQIIGLGVYIWNITQTTELVGLLKRIAPEVKIILGGPEVSYEWETQPVVQTADYVITGEADLEFARVCRALLAGESLPQKVIPAPLPVLDRLTYPYRLYTEQDLAHRIIYVEASRGCPFTCEFCLSSLDIPVRQFPMESFLAEMEQLLARGAKAFKFVDRTFNLNINFSLRILEFFLKRYEPGMFIHFEMIPDRLPEALRQIIAQFPAGALQFEVGIQTFDDETSKNISRRQDYGRLEDNFKFLRTTTGVHIHADLIVGLPGETLESFATGFDRLVKMQPQEIQVGILKRLRGTPIIRHDQEWSMLYDTSPPYEILRNRLLDFVTMQRMKRFARYWDMVANSGNFHETTAILLNSESSAFAAFLAFSDWLFQKEQRRHGIALERLAERLFAYLTETKSIAHQQIAEAIWRDFQRAGRKSKPPFLQPYIPDSLKLTGESQPKPAGAPKRQERHLTPTAPQAVG